MLEARNCSQTDEFFTRRRHEVVDVYYFSQSYFGLPRKSVRNNGDNLIVFKQTLRDVESRHKDFVGYDLTNCELKEMCRNAWSERFNFLCIELTRNKKMKVNIVYSMEAKIHKQNVFQGNESF